MTLFYNIWLQMRGMCPSQNLVGRVLSCKTIIFTLGGCSGPAGTLGADPRLVAPGYPCAACSEKCSCHMRVTEVACLSPHRKLERCLLIGPSQDPV